MTVEPKYLNQLERLVFIHGPCKVMIGGGHETLVILDIKGFTFRAISLIACIEQAEKFFQEVPNLKHTGVHNDPC